MKKIATLALAATAALSQPVLAQSSFVMIIGEWPEQRAEVASTVLTDEQRVEIAAEAACDKPFIRDLKGQALYAECMTEARAEAAAQIAETRAAPQLATR